MEDLRLAIIEDCKESLVDPHNNFTEDSQKDTCACYNNLNVLVRVLQMDKYKEEKWIMNWFSTLERHVLDKRCKHVWTKKRMNEAAWNIAEAKRH